MKVQDRTTCCILGCTEPLGDFLYLCAKHYAVWCESGESRRAHRDKGEDFERVWFTAFNDWVRRTVAEELNSK